MARLRVLVVEDSGTVRRHMMDILAADPEIELVGEAENGKDAIALAAALRPDLITLDMMLPVMTGVAATEYIMAHMPTPILIVSASTNRGDEARRPDAFRLRARRFFQDIDRWSVGIALRSIGQPQHSRIDAEMAVGRREAQAGPGPGHRVVVPRQRYAMRALAVEPFRERAAERLADMDRQ